MQSRICAGAFGLLLVLVSGCAEDGGPVNYLRSNGIFYGDKYVNPETGQAKPRISPACACAHYCGAVRNSALYRKIQGSGEVRREYCPAVNEELIYEAASSCNCGQFTNAQGAAMASPGKPGQRVSPNH